MRIPIIAIGLILGCSVVSASHAKNKQYLLYHPVELTDTLIRSSEIHFPLGDIVLEARCAVPSDSPRRGGISKNAWGLGLTNLSSSETVEIEVRRHTDYIDDVNGGRRLRLSVTTLSEDSISTIVKTDVDYGVSLTGGENTLIMSVTDNRCTISIGDRYPVEVVSFIIPFTCSGSIETYFRCSGTVRPSVFVVESSESNPEVLKTDHDVSKLLQGIGFSGNRIDGVWKYLDRQNDNDFARPGGFYIFATVTNSDKTEIIYLGGAEVADDQWQPGMLKGTLASTVFLNHFDLEWISASFERLAGEMFADLSDDGAILTLSFPELKSKMRFQRIPLAIP